MIGPLPTVIANSDAPAVEGQVEVAEGVALAASVVLDAAPGCRLVLAPGVCVGSGVIIQAIRGDLVIEPGVVLGSGVLVFGPGRIGQNACIGAESTLINPAIPSGQVVPSNSLIGDPSQAARHGTAPNPVVVEQTEQADSPNTTNGTRPPAHGQKQVQDLLAKLFPHRQPLN
jgi:carbon dioxide concentrating mechanism protein CcmN